MAIDTERLITALYNGMFLRDPSTEETAYWVNQIDIGVITPVGLVLLGAEDIQFTGVALQIAMMYEAAFDRYASTEQLTAWRVAYDTGLSLGDIGQSFILSNEFRNSNAGLTSTADYLQAMVTNGLGREVSQAELDMYVPLVDAGVVDYGDLLQLIVQHNGRGVQVGLAMLAAGVNGTAPESAVIEALDQSIPTAINTLVVNSPFYSSQTTTLDLVEDAGKLTITGGPLADDMTLNLTAVTVTVGGVNQALRSGKLSDVTSVDATGLTGDGSVNFIGSAGDDIYAASSAGDTIGGKGGNDQLTGGAGSDTFIFESTAAGNGVDMINNFQISNKDVLDLSAFLMVTGTSHIALVDAESTAATAWGNGDVLVVEGYDLTSDTAIAGLFGAGLAFADPTTRGKAVLIAADIIGNASVWFLVNQVDTGTITADEVVKVAELDGINNLGLRSFTADNFA